jgi:hypothetical protein
MAKNNYANFCVTPQDAIAKMPDGPAYKGSPGVYNGDKNFPGRDASDVGPAEKIYDKAMPNQPQDETRGTKA